MLNHIPNYDPRMSQRVVYSHEVSNEDAIRHLPDNVRVTLERLKWLSLSLPTQTLYKYCRAEHARGLLKEGAVRIGTFSYYRAQEKHDPLRGDGREATALFHDAPLGQQDEASLSPLTLDWFRPPADANIRLNQFQTHITVSDSFVFCTSLELSRSAAGDYDSCVAINDVPRFILALTHGLCRATGVDVMQGEALLAPITYMERELSAAYHGYINPAFLKEPRFSREQEARIVWRAPEPIGHSFADFCEPSLTQYVTSASIPV